MPLLCSPAPGGTPDGRPKLPTLVVIYRGLPVHDVAACTRALLSVGFDSFEVSLTSDGALASLELLSNQFGDQALIGAGTVLTVDNAHRVAERGARMALSPVADAAVIGAIRDAGMLAIPGAYSPTEMAAAHALGAEAVKLFPAANAGVGYLKLVLEPLPFLNVLATGGLDATAARAFLDAGAVSVGVGVTLLGGDAVDRRDWDTVSKRASDYLRVCAR